MLRSALGGQPTATPRTAPLPAGRHRLGILTSLTLTGDVITSAGLVLAATFCVLAAIPTVGSLQEGLLIAVGVLLDTLLVCSLLVPALALDIGTGSGAPATRNLPAGRRPESRPRRSARQRPCPCGRA